MKNNCKNLYDSEDLFRERRLVFDEVPGGPEAAEGASGGTESTEADAARLAKGKEVADGTDFLLDMLGANGNPDLRGFGRTKIEGVKIDAKDVVYDADGTTVLSVKATYRNISAVIEHDTPKEAIDKFKGYVGTLKRDQYEEFVFLPTSSIDLKWKKMDLHIDMKATLGDTFADEVSVTVSIEDDQIKKVTVTADGTVEIIAVTEKTIDEIDMDVLRRISEAIEPDIEALVAAAEAEEEKPVVEEPKEEKESIPTGKKRITMADIMAGKIDGPDDLVDGDVFVIDLGEIKFDVEIKKDGDNMTFKGELPLGSVKVPFEFGDDGMKITIGSKEIKGTLSGKGVEITGLGMDGKDVVNINFIQDIKNNLAKGRISFEGGIEVTLNGTPVNLDDLSSVNFVALLGGKDNLEAAGLTEEMILDLANTDLDLGDLGEDDTEEDGEEKKEGEEDKGTGSELVNNFINSATGESMKGFFDTFQELAQAILELLSGLGIDLNKKNDADRRLQLFVTNNRLGFKNIGTLNDTSFSDFFKCYEDAKGDGDAKADKAATLSNLEGLGFDTDGKNGDKLYETLEQLDDNMKEGEKGKELKSAMQSPDGNMDVSSFLASEGVIDKNGRWSTKWKKAPEVEEEEEEDNKELEQLKHTTSSPATMKTIVNSDNAEKRNKLVDDLNQLSMFNDGNLQKAYKTYQDSSKKPEDFRTLISTVTKYIETNPTAQVAGNMEYLFGNDPMVEKLWPDVLASAKTRFKGIEAGSINANEIADALISRGAIKLGSQTINFADSDKMQLTSALSKKVMDYDNKSYVDVEDSDNEVEALAKEFGLRDDQFAPLLNHLHDPENTFYSEKKITLGTIYNIPALSAHTFADLIAAVVFPDIFDIEMDDAEKDTTP